MASGRFQVNFTIQGFESPYYGYLLAEPQSTVTEVVNKISRHFQAMEASERYYQRNLYSIGARNTHSGRILIFRQHGQN